MLDSLIDNTPPLFAPLANLAALLLALAFRRNRAVLLLAVLTLAATACANAPLAAGRGEAAIMFTPWLLLATAALPNGSVKSVVPVPQPEATPT